MDTDDTIEALKNLAIGDVIKWTLNQRFTYVAIKIYSNQTKTILWYTTAQWNNPMVEQTIDTLTLAELLSNALVTFEVATRWKEILT